MPGKQGKKFRPSSFQIIISGFIIVILIGAVLLSLPISSQDLTFTPFNETIFTATSAVCVTGLVVHDTATYWSQFGQAVILVLIQIGGLGVITIVAAFSLLSGRKITLMQRNTMKDALSAHKIGKIVHLTRFIILATLAIEFIGAAVMAPVFCMKHGPKGIWMAVFHSISAFCNAGFDINGTENAKFSSLTGFAANPAINITIMLLIIIGGIGFLTWEDIITNKYHFKKYRVQSKLILVTSAALITVPALFFFFIDYKDLPAGERILASLFQSVTTRTAGFNTTDLNALTKASQGIMIILMLIGGSPGSTAGGMKTTTFAILVANAISVFRRKEDTEVFKRRIDSKIIKTAATIAFLYFILFFASAVAISTIEGTPFDVTLFETASAVGTVGLTLGITPKLGLVSQIILTILMFLGRVGGLTLIFATFKGVKKTAAKKPQETLTVG